MNTQVRDPEVFVSMADGTEVRQPFSVLAEGMNLDPSMASDVEIVQMVARHLDIDWNTLGQRVAGSNWNTEPANPEDLENSQFKVSKPLHGNIKLTVQAQFGDGDAAEPDANTPFTEAESTRSDTDAVTPDEQRGMYKKFRVERVDGSSKPGGKHEGCFYFVLDTKHDPHALPALVAYAKACSATHPKLADDIFALVERIHAEAGR